MFECYNLKSFNSKVKHFEKLCLLTPQGIYLKSNTHTVKEAGVLMLPGGETQPLYAGAYLETPEDILYWSLNISAQLCKPADFNF